ncbi:Fic family protein [Achromobacter marplatensis]|uniref:Fic family protein n=1 Tax=Achromobacter marplatensis TaxID=470868 RepID=UPI000277E929|nr:Fic family protein [Achromobacter marplatensis]EJO29541.1 filamentation induced by cAMP protein Fic 1 [Achromobacter marplatensis]
MTTREHILQLLRAQQQDNLPWLSSSELAYRTRASWSTVKRQLDALRKAGLVLREGQGRATRYGLAGDAPAWTPAPDSVATRVADPASETIGMIWSEHGVELLAHLRQPLASRAPVGYQRSFVDNYVPNQSSLLPPALAQTLADEGRMQGQQPAGTYARRVLEPLLLDLSWSSSRLEGNRYSLLATQELFKRGAAGTDLDAIMLLNHKAAIEFMIDAVPMHGLTSAVIGNLHAILMQHLLPNTRSLGRIRRTVVNIGGTTYLPIQAPALLQEIFDHIVEKARLIKNPVEAAFFFWVNLAYLQPFEDGNKRTSRLSANIPLMLYNCAPLSFLDVEAQDYAYAMMGVYERGDVTLAVDLFTWSYRRSIRKYAIQLDAAGVPDPIRLRFREKLNEAISRVVRARQTADAAVAALALSKDDAHVLRPMLAEELLLLDLYNCARYRLPMEQVQEWIEAGRPR